MKPNIFKLAVASALTLTGVQSQALPLLVESAALNSGSALTLYPDHQDPKKFYFMPNSSKIGRDNRSIPTFSFTYYGLKDPAATEGGALMVYVGRLTSDPDQAKALADFLLAHPGTGVAVLPIQESTVALTSTVAGSTPLKPFFSEFNFSTRAGRAEDEVGVNAVLTKVGAKIFRANLLGEAGASLKFDMCYKVQGLGPAMDGKIHARMDRIYDHFAASARGGYWWFSASISREVETLIQHNDVSWEINGGTAKDEDYIREATAQIVARLFKPELNMSQAGTGTVWDKVTPFSFNVSSTHKEEMKEETWIIKRRDLITREYCVPLVVKDISDYRKQCVIDADAQNFGAGQ
jgi:hypothetical protein